VLLRSLAASFCEVRTYCSGWKHLCTSGCTAKLRATHPESRCVNIVQLVGVGSHCFCGLLTELTSWFGRCQIGTVACCHPARLSESVIMGRVGNQCRCAATLADLQFADTACLQDESCFVTKFQTQVVVTEQCAVFRYHIMCCCKGKVTRVAPFGFQGCSLLWQLHISCLTVGLMARPQPVCASAAAVAQDIWWSWVQASRWCRFNK
jgi:hypothetical protein